MFGRRRSRCAFALIELLVVMAIIALLIGILLPSLAKAREQAMFQVCMAETVSDSVSNNGELPALAIQSGQEPPPGSSWIKKCNRRGCSIEFCTIPNEPVKPEHQLGVGWIFGKVGIASSFMIEHHLLAPTCYAMMAAHYYYFVRRRKGSDATRGKAADAKSPPKLGANAGHEPQGSNHEVVKAIVDAPGAVVEMFGESGSHTKQDESHEPPAHAGNGHASLAPLATANTEPNDWGMPDTMRGMSKAATQPAAKPKGQRTPGRKQPPKKKRSRRRKGD